MKEQTRSFLSRVRNSEFVRNTLTLAGGTTFAQIVSVSTAPFLYRIYEREDYGTLGLFMAFTGVIGSFSTLQYTQAILIEAEDRDAMTAIWLNRYVNLIFALLSLLFVALTRTFWGKFLGNQDVSPWLLLVPLSIFFSGQNEIYRTWANRKKKFKVLAWNTIVMSLLVPVFSIAIGLYYAGPLGLFVGYLAGQVIPVLILRQKLHFDGLAQKKVKSYQAVKILAIKHVNFPKFSLGSDLINKFTNNIPVFLLSKFLGPSVVGAYNLSVRMLGIPTQFLSSALAEVFRQRAVSDMNSTGSCRQIFIKTAKSLMVLSVPFLLVILFFGPYLFQWVFGAKWEVAGRFSQALIIMYALRLVVSPLTYVYVIAGKQREDLILHFWMLASTSAVLYFTLIKTTNSFIPILAYSINYGIIYLIYFLRSLKFTKIQE